MYCTSAPPVEKTRQAHTPLPLFFLVQGANAQSNAQEAPIPRPTLLLKGDMPDSVPRPGGWEQVRTYRSHTTFSSISALAWYY